MSGGGSDPSAYYALSPGGRFPGDISNYLGYLQAHNTGGQLGNGNEDKSNINIPGNYGKLVSLILNGIINNARSGGAGQAPGNPLTDGGPPYQLYSGPGASFGPRGGSLNGLLDQGNLTPVDGTDNPFNHLDTAGIPDAPSGGGRHGGGGGGGSFGFTPYSGVPYTASFVGYSPTQPGAVQHAAPLIQTLVNAGLPSSSSPGKSSGGQGGGSSPGGNSGGGGGGHRVATWAVGGAPPAVPPGGSKRPDGRILDAQGRTIWAPGPGGSSGSGGSGGAPAGPDAGFTNPTAVGQFGGKIPQGGIPINIFGPGVNGAAGATPTDRDPHGVNFNNLDKGTPGWLRDPTQGIQNTAGMPLPTLPDPKGMTADQYITLLHDLGYTQEDIAGLVSNYGFNIGNPQAGPPAPGGRDPGEADNASWGWGVGPVVRDTSGYHFASQSPGGGGGRTSSGENAASTLNSGANAWWMTR